MSVSNQNKEMMVAGEVRKEQDRDLLDEKIQETPKDLVGTFKIYTPFVLWYSDKSKKDQRSQTAYENTLQQVSVIRTLEEFWGTYCFLKRPDDFGFSSDFHLFKEGILPVWEDDNNKLGGKWIVRLRKGLASRYWENLLLAIVGNQFQVGNELCGAVVSVRFGEDIISVWNRSAHDKSATYKIRDTIKKILSLPSNVIMEYKCHDASIRDQSSFRNTDVF
eukprot:CFRG1379T1